MTFPAVAWAQAYPAKPVQVVAASPAGAASDLAARIVADRLGTKLGRRFVVEDRPAAGGVAAAEYVAKAKPDGYTLLIAQASTLAMNPHLNKTMPLDVLKDLAPVIEIGAQPLTLAVPSESRFHSLVDLIADAKTHPARLNIAVISLSLSQLAYVLLNQSAAIDTNLVPFTAQAELTTAGLGGEVDGIINGAGSLLGMVQAGKLRALAVTGAERLEVMPTVPTVAETLPGYEAASWFGVFAPAGTDPKIVSLLNENINELLHDPAFRSALVQQGTSPVGGSPEILRDRLLRDYDKFGALIRAAGLQTN